MAEHEGKRGLELSETLDKSAEQIAKDQIAKFNKEVSDLVVFVESYCIEHDLTNGHVNALVEAFNARNAVVVPEMKIATVKRLFESVTNTEHA